MPGSHELNLAISPYHLTAGDATAAAALLLADHAVTLLPVPEGFVGGMTGPGREQIAEAVERSPRYLRVLEAWRWTIPLWRAGVLGSTLGGEDTADEPHGVFERLSEDEGLAALRGLVRPVLFEDPDQHLDLLSGDLLRGGPDPGISLLLTAGLDAFAHRHGMASVRAGFAAGSGSVLQRAEAGLGERLAAVAVPVLLRASGERILIARRVLETPLAALRRALMDLAQDSGGSGGGGGGGAAVVQAAEAYTRAFEAAKKRLVQGDDNEGWRVEEGLVSLALVRLPADAAIRSCMTAAKAIDPRSARADASARADGDMLAIVIRRMNMKTDSGTAAPAPPRAAHR